MKKHNVYFGAANGYSGFRSNFANIFSADKVDKLFIIKGGPGTGKSTLMRKIHNYYTDNFNTTEILCSSDPGSLDGVLIEKDGRTVGIVDGTAPHVMEPAYPGAREEIINLGDAFDIGALSKQKDYIIELSDKKKAHYKSAYDSLRIAGDINEYISANFVNNDYYYSAEVLIEQLTKSEISNENTAVRSDFLVGSFSKNGYKRLEKATESKELITIKGDGISEYFLTSAIEKRMRKSGIKFTVFYSALSPTLPDLIETESCIYTVADNNHSTIDSSLLMPKTCEYERLKGAYRCFIENAQIALIKASEHHFKLEAIYSSCIAFDENENKRRSIIEKIDALFDK